MKTNFRLDERPLSHALYVFVIASTVLLIMPKRASAQLYVTQEFAGTVSEYNETSGALINANFITGLTDPSELALSGDILFVGNLSGSVGKHDAKTGAAINPSFITGTEFFPGGLAVLRDELFVLNVFDGTLGKYNSNTGKAIKVHFITGLPTSSVPDSACWATNCSWRVRKQARWASTTPQPGRQLRLTS